MRPHPTKRHEWRTCERCFVRDARRRTPRAGYYERCKLIGHSLAEVAADSLPEEMPAGPLCLFTWSASRPVTLTIATRLAQDLPTGTTLVAICLDADPAPARALPAVARGGDAAGAAAGRGGRDGQATPSRRTARVGRTCPWYFVSPAASARL